MWKAATDVTAPALAEADDWETDPDFVNDISEHEQRWGPGGRNVEAIEYDEDAVKEIQDEGVTNFLYEEEQHYCQSACHVQKFMLLPNEGVAANEKFGEKKEVSQELVLPTVSSIEEESYVVVRNDCNNNVNINQVEHRNGDVYKFQKEHEVLNEIDYINNKNDKRRTCFTCNFCSFVTYRRYRLIRHVNRSHSDCRPHKCHVCGKSYKTMEYLQYHLNVHYGVKPHACKDCNSTFTRPGELLRHIRYKHTKEKPHKCTECDYAAVESSKLRRHLRLHTVGRPYHCRHCSYTASDTSKLQRPLYMHTGEKLYVCEYCDMCFNESNTLKVHKLIHDAESEDVDYINKTVGNKKPEHSESFNQYYEDDMKYLVLEVIHLEDNSALQHTHAVTECIETDVMVKE